MTKDKKTEDFKEALKRLRIIGYLHEPKNRK